MDQPPPDLFTNADLDQHPPDQYTAADLDHDGILIGLGTGPEPSAGYSTHRLVRTKDLTIQLYEALVREQAGVSNGCNPINEILYQLAHEDEPGDGMPF